MVGTFSFYFMHLGPFWNQLENPFKVNQQVTQNGIQKCSSFYKNKPHMAMSTGKYKSYDSRKEVIEKHKKKKSSSLRSNWRVNSQTILRGIFPLKSMGARKSAPNASQTLFVVDLHMVPQQNPHQAPLCSNHVEIHVKSRSTL